MNIVGPASNRRWSCSSKADKGALGTGMKLAQDLKNYKNCNMKNNQWSQSCPGIDTSWQVHWLLAPEADPMRFFLVKSLGWPSSHQDYAKPTRVDVAILGVGADSELSQASCWGFWGVSTLAWIKLKYVEIQKKAKKAVSCPYINPYEILTHIKRTIFLGVSQSLPTAIDPQMPAQLRPCGASTWKPRIVVRADWFRLDRFDLKIFGDNLRII